VGEERERERERERGEREREGSSERRFLLCRGGGKASLVKKVPSGSSSMKIRTNVYN
jgi:hypothetical protein